MIDFNALKKNRESQLANLTDQLKKLNGSENQSSSDDRYWYPAVDKAGNGYAVVRFLPAPGGEDVPFIRIFEHGFKGPTGKWYIEKSLTTLGLPDPCGEYNQKLWNSTTDDASPARKQVREQKRKLVYVANVYVISDSINPENEGKVFLFKFGKKIFDKLNGAMNPQFQDEKALNPFDLWEGANFKIKIRNVEKRRNYDSSEFDKPSALDSDDEMEKIWKSAYLLQPLIAQDKFKSYDALKRQLDLVLDLKGSPMSRADDDDEDEAPVVQAPRLKAKAAPRIEEVDPPWSEADEDDEEMSYFKNLLKDN